jgi:hypothetical protein
LGSSLLKRPADPRRHEEAVGERQVVVDVLLGHGGQVSDLALVLESHASSFSRFDLTQLTSRDSPGEDWGLSSPQTVFPPFADLYGGVV